MQPGPPPPLAIATPPERREAPWPFWAIVLGGVLVAFGVASPAALFLFAPTGILTIADAFTVEGGYQAGAIVVALGFFVAFVGVAASLRTPLRVSRSATKREFVVVLSGGLLVVAGASVTAATALYTFAKFFYAVPTWLAALEVGGPVVEAVGSYWLSSGSGWPFV